MARTSEIENYWQSNSEDELGEQGEEEALSLCDLPVSAMDEENQTKSEKSENIQVEDDFDFGALAGSITAIDCELRSADEIFFSGQIVPLHRSISSDAGYLCDSQNGSRSISRSESMSGFRISSTPTSRSSSTKSNYSISSSSSWSSSHAAHIPKVRNNFHTQPSPKPQIHASGALSVPNCSSNRKSHSSLWDFVRLGLVRTPEIELRNPKARRAKYSSDRSITSRSTDITSKNPKICDLNVQKERKQKLNGNYGGIFDGCKCSVWVAEPIPATRLSALNSNDCNGATGEVSAKVWREIGIGRGVLSQRGWAVSEEFGRHRQRCVNGAAQGGQRRGRGRGIALGAVVFDRPIGLAIS
ncbi:hypothetical protein Nepgr_025899 [Nepenthes gracilis]|uniref:Uncharacterized protein n=1 Tax=Nepenthes gracilis TaxID=150966 RepID=A0AAD3T7L2_NEPGR|nr:hypothetical protein Nepgr_025899 [Nepenthes gracilis]